MNTATGCWAIGDRTMLVAPGEGAIMAAPEGAMAPLVDGSERARRCRISLAMESQESRDAGPEGPTNRARQAREKEARGGGPWLCDKLLSLRRDSESPNWSV